MDFSATRIMWRVLFLLGLVQGNDWDQCTSVVVGPKASVDGSTYATHTNDCAECDSRIVYIAPQDYPEGGYRPIWPYKNVYPREIGTGRSHQYDESAGLPKSKALGSIPQVRHTFGYWEGAYPFINEHGVGFGESTTFFKLWSALPDTDNIMYVHETMRIALERCKTARCAIQTMGDLSVEYGFYGEGQFTSESVSVIDPVEAWVFQVGNGLNNKSAVWAAQRVPDDHVAVIANGLTIRVVDPTDRDNFMVSDNLFAVAKEAGFWDGKEPFDFTKTMQQDIMTFAVPGHAPIPSYISMRMWRVYDRVAPSLKLQWEKDPLTLPFSVKVDRPLTHREVMDLKRDHFEGTAYDMRDGIVAGPWRDPNRVEGLGNGGEFPRAIAIPRTSTSVVIQSRPGAAQTIGSAGIAWVAVDDPSSSVHVPFYANTAWHAGIPNVYARGNMFNFSRDSAWWAFNFVANWMMKNYEHMSAVVLPKVQDVQDMIDRERLTMEDTAATLMSAGKPDEARALIEKFQNDIQERVVKKWWELADYLVMRFSDLADNACIDAGGPPSGDAWKLSCKVGSKLPYPSWYLEEVHFDSEERPHWMSASSLYPPASFKDTAPRGAPWVRLPGSGADGGVPPAGGHDPSPCPGGAATASSSDPFIAYLTIFIAGLCVGGLFVAAVFLIVGRRRMSRIVVGQEVNGMSLQLTPSRDIA